MLSNRLLSVDTCWGLVAEMGSIRDCLGHGSHLLGTVKRERFRLVVFHLDCLNNQPFFLSRGRAVGEPANCAAGSLPSQQAELASSSSGMWVPFTTSLLSSEHEGHPYLLQPQGAGFRLFSRLSG